MRWDAEVLFKGIFGGGSSAPPPAAAPVVAMPDTDNEQVKAARQRAEAARRMATGRESTLLSGGEGYGSTTTLGTQ